MALAEDPPQSEAQRRLMWATAGGANTGVPASVAKEFTQSDPGGKLPEKVGKDFSAGNFKMLRWLLNKFFEEEESEREHQEPDVSRETPDGVILDKEELGPRELSETTRENIGTPGSPKREDMPEWIFLGPDRTYPTAERKNGEWKRTRKLLEAAASRARLNKEPEIERKAEALIAKEFGSSEEEDEGIRVHAIGHGGKDTVCDPDRHVYDMACDSASVIAYDQKSERWVDGDGRLHVDVANICQGKIDKYTGKEVNQAQGDEPGWEPLDEEKSYRLFRDPAELAKPETVKSANGIPILSTHIPTSADDHKFSETVGSTGTEARFEYPFIRNALVFWPQKAIDGIDDGSKAQLSPGYSYKVDPTPGTFEGEPYDLRMTNIRFNHLAQVPLGRQGARVVVPDADPEWRHWLKVERALLDF